ncbi:chorismate mutase [Photorhabdus temperata]|uniref:Chorismate mutase n=2 Tax=Photorhabdus temperata TaxID=574560 RepID=A0A081RX51_PHOTE|nr:chorismate mutase [Photorhabdus temperata]EQB99994.1 chorismate mutase [Photorhabdus temperata subsp. temperata M1021]ERT13352.1 chorismate mutase [Photorhabdus temperata J3]KER03254.1 putative chorismate mutase [Photorhabdus temperata subsp. temperata Meg1]MCT8347399.1 chorismate mutase [Photorhabdus temperata]
MKRSKKAKIIGFIFGFALVMSAMFPMITLATETKTTVAQLINQRLSYMKDVAGYKAENHLPVEVMAQEDKVLAKSISEAESFGLSGESVRPFIIIQMDAAKAIQYRYRADWLSIPENGWQPKPLDDVRIKISGLSTEILQQIAILLKDGEKIDASDKEMFMANIQQHNLKDSDKQQIFAALEKVKLK